MLSVAPAPPSQAPKLAAPLSLCARVLENDAVGAEDVAVIAEELNLVQVGRQIICRLVLLPRGATILRTEDGATTAHSPRILAIGEEGDVKETVPSRADLELVEGD